MRRCALKGVLFLGSYTYVLTVYTPREGLYSVNQKTMSGKTNENARVPQNVSDGLEQMSEDMDATKSEAHRRALEQGLIYYGYLDDYRETELKTLSDEIGRTLLSISAALLVVSLVMQADIWQAAIPFAVVGMLSWSIALVEPNVTVRYRRVMNIV